ncbi:cryptochrome/photolyase family protein [Thiomicrorhabdus arctica]|uniref:cryptochrome/photolyase family protein n=1 Tax=Thiomicrorhabdus arctica TaxID=131540 RepID=UPI00037C8C2C|nr:FAD-binding domain-containing protein [Thiomicrorhabdus arctica]
MTSLVWLQREFRLTALPALQMALSSAWSSIEAAESSLEQRSEKSPGQVIFAYFHDPRQTVGDANTLWLAQGLQTLQQTIRAKGGDLWIIEGDFESKFSEVLSSYHVNQVFYTFQVGAPFKSMQQQAMTVCQNQGVVLQPFYSEFLVEPDKIRNQQNNPYLVFTPFYKTLLAKQVLIEPLDESVGDLSATAMLKPYDQAWLGFPTSLQILLRLPWAQKMMANVHASHSWQVGEEVAWQTLQHFIENDLPSYDEDRDFPKLSATSLLSPHLHFGEINLRDIFFYLQALIADGTVKYDQAMPWFRQLAWKEFAAHLLVNFPQTETEPFQSKYQSMSWQTDKQSYQAWQKGLTGIPIIDAGMRELWQTGFMHNRVRMLVASFLTKNLNQHWLLGKNWFDHTLFDADPANNVMGWQWVAGCGVDASPYYRLFNPVTQSTKFDADGEYIKTWLPELKALSKKAIHSPWEHSAECLAKGIVLGQDYPLPIADLKQSRIAHLERVEAMKSMGRKA